MNKEDYLEDISGISKLVSEINLDDMEYEGMENDFQQIIILFIY